LLLAARVSRPRIPGARGRLPGRIRRRLPRVGRPSRSRQPRRVPLPYPPGKVAEAPAPGRQSRSSPQNPTSLPPASQSPACWNRDRFAPSRILALRPTGDCGGIYVHGVPLDTSWFCSYCCATVDMAFVTRALAQPLGVLRRGHKQRSPVVCADAGQGHQVGCYPATSQLSWTSNSSASVR
jgi:hypothetical protein